MPLSKIFLIDGHALCYRAFYGISGLANSKGQATNAVFGFTNTLLKILKEYAPSHMAVCFDTGKKTRRQEKFQEYKIQRPSMPEDLISQIPIIKEVIRAYHVPIFELDGYEADDLIATIVHKFKGRNFEVVIASDDKDMYQLVGDGVGIYSFRHDKIMGVKESEERFGIKPSLITDYLALCGDASDNIPGVNGIGEVTARSLINEFGALENIYAHLDDIKQVKVREKLDTQKEGAFFSKELAILEGDAPVDVKVDELAVPAPDTKELHRLFTELEFRKLAQELNHDAPAAAARKAVEIEDASGVNETVAKIKKAKQFAVLCSGSRDTLEGVRIWFCVSDQVTVAGSRDLDQFKSIFEDASIRKITYDSKALCKILDSSAVSLAGEVFDALLAGYLLVSGLAAFDISSLSWQYLKESVDEQDRAAQVVALEKLADVMAKDLVEKNVEKLYRELEVPLAMVLAEMEKEGVKIDVDALGKLSRECDARIRETVTRLYALAQTEFNVNSPKQLSDVLFVKLKLPVIKKTKTGFSTDEEVLSRLAPKHEIAQVILDYRQISKLKSTYIDVLPRLVDADNRLHATFNQTGAETGRLSSNNPNLQNIPIRTEMGREIRRAFVPFNPGDQLLSADYSQIELRILAHLSQDAALIKAFQEDQDIHAYTAGLIFDVAEDKVDAHMRNAAKRVNFGIIYGISAFGLAKDLGVSNPEAQDFIDRYFMRYPLVKAFMDNEIKKAQDLGYVTTLFNRRRYIPEIKSKNIGLRQFAERQAINTPVQGSAADLMKMAMINIAGLISKNNMCSRMISTVHDELVFNVPINERPAMVPLVRDAMEHVCEFSVPITASVKIGKNWLQMEKV